MSDFEQQPADTSRRAYVLAREIDRVCRQPGRYCVTLEVGLDRQGVWSVEITAATLDRRFGIDRHGNISDVSAPLRPPPSG